MHTKEKKEKRYKTTKTREKKETTNIEIDEKQYKQETHNKTNLKIVLKEAIKDNKRQAHEGKKGRNHYKRASQGGHQR